MSLPRRIALVLFILSWQWKVLASSTENNISERILMTAGSPFTLIISSQDEFLMREGAVVSAILKGGSSTGEDLYYAMEANSNMELSITPQKAGAMDLEIRKAVPGMKPIVSGYYRFQIKTDGLDMTSGYAMTINKDLYKAGDQIQMTIKVRDKYQNPTQASLDSFEITARHSVSNRIYNILASESQAWDHLDVATISTIAGTFTVFCRYEGFHVHGSPFQINISPNVASVSSFRTVGDGLSIATAGISSQFTVFSFDEHGNEVSISYSNMQLNASKMFGSSFGSQFKVLTGQSSPFTIAAYDSYMNPINLNDVIFDMILVYSVAGVKDVRGTLIQVNGSSVIVYNATKAGYGRVVNCILTPGISETSVEIVPAPVCASKSQLLGSGLTLMTAGTPSKLSIVVQDSFQNDVPGETIVLREYDTSSMLYNTSLQSFSVSINQKGSFLVSYYLLLSGGLSSTYYSDRFFTTPILASTQDSQLPALSGYYGGRKRGFLKPKVSGMYTIYVNSSSPTRLYFNGMTLFDSFLPTSPLVINQQFYLATSNLYEVVIEYFYVTGVFYLELDWSGSGFDRQVVDPEQLVFLASIGDSPFSVQVLPSSVCASMSTVSGQALGVQTAGLISILYVQTKDSYGNDLNSAITNQIIVEFAIETKSAKAVRSTASYFSAGLWAFIIQNVNIAGSYNIFCSLTEVGGITAAVSSADSVATITQSLSSLSFNVSNLEIPSDWNSLNAHLTGFLQISSSLSRTFELTLLSVNDRVRIWIDNFIFVDQWDSLQSLTLQSNYTFKSTSLFYFEADYSTSTLSSGLSLRWKNALVTEGFVSITSNNLFFSYPINASPYKTTVNPSISSPTLSQAYGNELSLTTAGTLSQFAVRTRDQYGNSIDTCEYSRYFQISQAAYDYQNQSVSTSADCSISYLLTHAGRYDVDVSFLYPGSLSATYYQSLNLTSPKASLVEGVPNVNLCTRSVCSCNGVPTGSNLLRGQSFSFRYQGSIVPVLGQTYNFSLKANSIEERMRLWIDDQLLVDSWSSLASLEVRFPYTFPTTSSFYPIRVEANVRCAANYDLELQWQVGGAAFSLVPSSAFIAQGLFQGFPQNLTVNPSAACTGACLAQGMYLTLATAGAQSTFSIFINDAYGNPSPDRNLTIMSKFFGDTRVLSSDIHDGEIYGAALTEKSGLRVLNLEGLANYSESTTGVSIFRLL
ncbi:hypothetical protein GUITHDRAFT_139133 [Guillardia theta CCMP2712]|uniref:PA14 domain-containing protein n=1 Tax=Guillardia theta (strain CCMP2712) TaxID=905079 RepID=L1JAT4_GUITC|nr:hypothetical protein GUITHDRAFT_139133 [Guillardia theta CCMP2712]EKX45209.1 hypothetical protein GUITHDRAFT_139133 [Guillardia theta CCMP2712]|eukprot:XP_005832189.1 hypothetical protein GUITHDRAFT_139133 [Guillardia theta CCMP2712]